MKKNLLVENMGKAKMKAVVTWYRTAFAQDYEAFVEQNKVRKESIYDEYGSAATAGVATMRHIHEIPENMWKQIVQTLAPEEMAWFTTPKANRWFAEEFPQFAIAKKFAKTPNKKK